MFYEYHNSCREIILTDSIRIDLLDKYIVSFELYSYEDNINYDGSLNVKETTYLWHGKIEK